MKDYDNRNQAEMIAYLEARVEALKRANELLMEENATLNYVLAHIGAELDVE